jgi:hypothetical protein
MRSQRLFCSLLAVLCLSGFAHADDPNGTAPRVDLYFFWSLTCPHCMAAHPHIVAIADERPWVKLHALELSRQPENVDRYVTIARQIGADASAVPALIFCGEMHTGWDSNATTGAFIRERLDACQAKKLSGSGIGQATPAAETIRLPLFGRIDPASISLPLLTLVLAGLDAFNPCAFFVLLFLLSMMAHQKSRSRMLMIGGVFVAVSGLMYFAFMAAWLNVFQIFGHLAWVTLTAGALAIVVGAINVKDFLRLKQELTLSIPAARKADIFRRARDILSADSLPAMLLATSFLAVAANFYELLCTAGFPMVFTRLLTMAELSPAGRYAYLAAYNLIYVIPLAAIVAVFAGTLGARKLSEREGRLLKLLSGLMMLGLGTLLLLAPERINQVGIAFGLMAAAVSITFIAAKRTAE